MTKDEGLDVFSIPPIVAGWISQSQYGLRAEAYDFAPSRDRSLLLMRYLLANDIPVTVLQRLLADATISHYRVIQGYADKTGEFIADDPLLSINYFPNLSRPVR